MEPTILFQRKREAPIRTETLSQFYLDVRDNSYYAVLYDGDANEKPFSRALTITNDGVEMVDVPTRLVQTSDNQYVTELGTGDNIKLADQGVIYVVFNRDYDPRGHVIVAQYEGICRCVGLSQDAFRPSEVCEVCYGTGYVGGYDRYLCDAYYEGRRMVVPGDYILVRYPLETQKVVLRDFALQIENANHHWTFSEPIVYDWDVIVRRTGIGATDYGWYFVIERQFSGARVFNDDSGLLSQRFNTQVIQQTSVARRLAIVE